MSKRKTPQMQLVYGVVAAIGLLALTTPSQAYDRGDCNYLFGAANVYKAEQFRVFGGQADFGDNPHLLGQPQGTAVVCWCVDGRVAIKGRIFTDGGLHGETVSVFAQITVFKSNGQGTTVVKGTTGNFASSSVVNAVSNNGFFSRVRIRLYDSNISDLGDGPNIWLKTKNLYR